MPEKEQFSKEMKSLFIFDEYNKSDRSVVLENFVSLLNITLIYTKTKFWSTICPIYKLQTSN